MTDVETRAKKLLEAEREHEARLARKRAHQEEETRYRDALKKIKQADREEAAAQARREAAAEAADLAAERHDLAEQLEDAATRVKQLLDEYADLDRRHRDTLSRAGRSMGHDASLKRLLPRWFAHRFGGFNSIVGVLGTHPSGKDRSLPERDPLARTGADKEAV